MSSTKICKVCGETKDKTDFRVNTRLCKSCYEIHNKIYMDEYYRKHKERLMKMNLEAYYVKNPIRKKMGRPCRYFPEEENTLTC